MNFKLLFLVNTFFYFFSTSSIAQKQDRFGANISAELPIPRGVNASDSSISAISVFWKYIPNMTYRVYRSDRSSNLTEQDFYREAKEESIVNYGSELIKEHRYFYGVKSIKGNSKSKWSNIDSGYIRGGVASISPSGLFPYQSVAPNNLVQLTCSEVASADQYRFQIAKKGSEWTTENGFINGLLQNELTTEPTFDWQSLPISDTYLWSVAVIEGDSLSHFSFPIDFDISEEPPLSSGANKIEISNLQLEDDNLTINKYFALTTTLENTTSQPITHFRIAYFLSDDAILDDNDLKIGNTHFFDVAAQETISITPMKQITKQVEASFYWIIAVSEEAGRLNKENYKIVPVIVR
ncbi:MAG: hypothetical protein ACPG19_00245 [Saprospiraceae bacterium]